MTFHFHDRVVLSEINGDGVAHYSGFVSGITTETRPKYDVTLDIRDKHDRVIVKVGVEAAALRREEEYPA